MLGSFALINSGVDSVVNRQREPRYTPYHIRHRTEVAGFMTILHGDDRIYNNIIIQHYPVTDPEKTPADNDYEAAGTAPFDIFPSHEEWIGNFMLDREPDMHALAEYHFGHLPVWVEGNACFGGATVSRHEKHGLQSEEKPVVELVCGSGGPVLRTNIYDLLGNFRGDIVSSEVLGCAFEPEQRFENPDGSDLILDRDFFGDHRGTDVLPGPFSAGTAECLRQGELKFPRYGTES